MRLTRSKAIIGILLTLLGSFILFYTVKNSSNDRKFSINEEPIKIAFYYKYDQKLEECFDIIVVQPDAEGIKAYNVIYRSVGEIDKDSMEISEISSEWIAGENPNWNSYVMDM